MEGCSSEVGAVPLVAAPGRVPVFDGRGSFAILRRPRLFGVGRVGCGRLRIGRHVLERVDSHGCLQLVVQVLT